MTSYALSSHEIINHGGTPTEVSNGSHSTKLPLTGEAKTSSVAGSAARLNEATLEFGNVPNPPTELERGGANPATLAATQGNLGERSKNSNNLLAGTIATLAFIATAVPLAVINWVPGTLVRVGLSLAGLFKPKAVNAYIENNEKFLGRWMGTTISTHPAFCGSAWDHARNLGLDLLSGGVGFSFLNAIVHAEASSEYFYKEIVKASRPDPQAV